MYEPFFGLDNSPFGLTPDPRFLFRSRGHHDILATLLYGVTTSKGIMLLIGDVGTGKTTLCRALLRDLPEQAESVLILNPHLSGAELIGAILDDLGLARPGSTSKGELMTVLGQHLLATGAAGKTVVVLVDEAQQMSPESLEQIRLLSTLEAPGRKLLQIVLAGQPELEAKLARPELRQLDQRIALRCRLGPLSPAETARYVEHRLRTAGLGGSLPFTRAAIARVHRHSGGVPRVINLVCDRALAAAFAARSRQVEIDTVKVAMRSLRGASRSSARARPVASLAMAAGAVVALVGLIVGAQPWWQSARPIAAPPSGIAATVTRAPAAAATPSAPLPTPALSVVPVSAPATGLASPPPVAPPAEPQRRLLADLIALWSSQPLPPAVVAAWPAGADGMPDVATIGARYELAATRLIEPTAQELRAVGLPALLRMQPGRDGTVLLLRRVGGETATLRDASGREIVWPFSELTARLTGVEAWLLWRNLDGLPIHPGPPMTPAVAMAIGLRLHKLGHLALPLPQGTDARLEQGISAFQRSVGLADDGVMGPRTTLALSRVVAGRLAPTILEASR
jgi:general secretion pathway protein A